MSLEVLDGKVLANPPHPEYLACLPETLEQQNGHLTPTSNSWEEPQSESSSVDCGDTRPSSVEEHHRESAVVPAMYKLKDIELNSEAVPVLTQVLPQMVIDHKHSELHPREQEPAQNRATENLAVSHSRKSGLSLQSDLAAAHSIGLAPYNAEASPTQLTHSRSLLLTKRRHTDSAVPRSRTSVGELVLAANVSKELRPANISSYSLFKSRTVADLHLQTKQSVADNEYARMRTSLIRRSTLRRNGATEPDYVILGNKIDEGHRNFVMAYNMLTGIRVAVSGCSGVMKSLSDSDFRSTKKLTFNADGSELTPSSKYDFKFKDYCPEVFRELRSLFGIDPADYLMSITGKYILSELGSPGKSGSFFYYSRDFRFIIKTIHHAEHKQLRRILKTYYSHVKENPNTLVSQFYGLHRLKVNGGMKKIHFIVMNNLFPPHRDIHLKYDLKGSTWGRYTRIDTTNNDKDKDGKEEQKKDISDFTLKDLNWLEREDKIKFGPEKRQIFTQQLEADVKFMKKINVMDYSLLLGVHDVKKGNSLTTEKLSVYEPKSNVRSELFKTNPRDIDRGVDLPRSVFPGRSKYIFYGHDGGIRATDEEDKPLPEIYYLGIIDCLTNYSFKKRLETLWRSLSHSRSTISAIPAKEYGDRFVNFIRAGISTNKVKTS